MEEKKYGQYYECVMAQFKDKPKMSLAQLKDKLNKTHTLEAQWERIEKAKGGK